MIVKNREILMAKPFIRVLFKGDYFSSLQSISQKNVVDDLVTIVILKKDRRSFSYLLIGQKFIKQYLLSSSQCLHELKLIFKKSSWE